MLQNEYLEFLALLHQPQEQEKKQQGSQKKITPKECGDLKTSSHAHFLVFSGFRLSHNTVNMPLTRLRRTSFMLGGVER